MRRLWIVALLALAACRGHHSERAPRHLFDDMDWQPKYRPEATSAFFRDGRAMRSPVEGTVAQGAALEEPALAPRVSAAIARRGEERFSIYCSPCHDHSGSGRGTVVMRGFPPPVDLASQRVLGLADGQLFDTITHGVRNMPSYAAQIPVEDRWAIVLWVRILQRARHGALDDVPEPARTRLQAETE